MISVVGFNTAIDRRVDVDTLRPGQVQRAVSVRSRPGGKGLHVAETVAALGEPVRLVGLADTEHATQLHNRLGAHGVGWLPVSTTHPLRQCLAIHEADGRVTEVLESGGTLAPAVCEALLDAARAAIEGSDVVVFTGSLPHGIQPVAYAQLIRDASARGVRCLLDASGDVLRTGVGAKPWLVKPNADEAALLIGRPVHGLDDAADCARWLYRNGVARCVVTLGARGAVGFDGAALWHATSGTVEVRSSVGSGDCFLAGLAVAAVRGEPIEDALRQAVACGAANAENTEDGVAPPERVAAWLKRTTLAPLPMVPEVAP